MYKLRVLVFFLIVFSTCHGQEKHARKSKGHTNEFFVSAGYNYCQTSFFDAGLRYYKWTNDGQTALAFSGPAAGCEFSLNRDDLIYIPYVGWQGQLFGLAYGLRAEYAIGDENQAFGLSPELGLSLIEMLRVTAGYRFSFGKNDPLDIRGFRFSIIAGFPLSFLKKN